MIKNKPASKIPLVILDEHYFLDWGIDELVMEQLFKAYPEYLAALDQSGVALENSIMLGRDEDPDEEDYCLYREFDADKNLRGRIKILLSDDHIDEAKLLAEKIRVIEELPPPPKKKSKRKAML